MQSFLVLILILCSLQIFLCRPCPLPYLLKETELKTGTSNFLLIRYYHAINWEIVTIMWILFSLVPVTDLLKNLVIPQVIRALGASFVLVFGIWPLSSWQRSPTSLGTSLIMEMFFFFFFLTKSLLMSS